MGPLNHKLILFLALPLAALGSRLCDYSWETLGAYPLEDRLRLIAGPEIPYWNSPNFSEPDDTRISQVHLNIEDPNASTQASSALSQGGSPSSPDEINQALQSYQNDGHRQIPLQWVLPWFARQFTNTSPLCDNANCFNATVNWFLPDTGFQAMDESRMEDFIRDSFEPVESGSRLKLGDLIAIRDKDGELYHTAIYLGGNLFWHKPSGDRRDPWTFDTMDNLVRPYFEILGEENLDVSFFRIRPTQNTRQPPSPADP